jgi:putative SOS response-associated peptidase YedK
LYLKLLPDLTVFSSNMCGRYTLKIPPEYLLSLFDIGELPPDMPPPAARYNIAPTQPILIVRTSTRPGEREVAHVVWGLIPPWSKDPTMGARMINARSETAAEKPSFRTPLRRRRCLVPATGFYEWRKNPGGTKQPFVMHRKDGAPFAMAGIWETWKGPGDGEIDSAAILTTGPNALMKSIHDRMPVIIEPKDFALWLDPLVDNTAKVQHLMRPAPDDFFQATPVSTMVNNPRNDGPDCIAPLVEPDGGEGDLFR